VAVVLTLVTDKNQYT